MSKNQGLSAEEKVKLVRRCLAGEMSVSEAGRQAGVHHKSIQRWIDQYEAEGAEGFFPQERNRVYSAEIKERAVRDYLSNAGSLQDICKKYKIRSNTQLRKWIKVYTAHGDFHAGRSSESGV